MRFGVRYCPVLLCVSLLLSPLLLGQNVPAAGTDDAARAVAMKSGKVFPNNPYGRMSSSIAGDTSWSEVNTGLPASAWVYALAVKDSSVLAGIRGGVFVSTNAGQNWSALNTGLTDTVVTALAVSVTALFAGTNSGVFRSSDNGAHWVQVNTGLTDPTVMTLKVKGSNLFAGTTSGLFRMPVGGTDWTAVNSGLPSSIAVLSLGVKDTIIYAGTTAGVFRSSNDGTSWTAVNKGLVSLVVTALIAKDTNLYAGTGKGVFRLARVDSAWTAVNRGMAANRFVYDIVVKDSTLFAGTDGDGVFMSTNNGENWTQETTGLTNMFVTSLAISGSGDSSLFAGTYLGGVWQRKLTSLVIVADVAPFDGLSARGYRLDQNYPNPFNPLTTVGFHIAESGTVSVKVYDVLGREIATLINERMAPGSYSVQFDGTGLSSGVYFYVLRAGGIYSVKSMQLAK